MDPEMEVFAPLYPVVPVFVLIAVGFIFARCKKISLIPITELIVYLGTPSLVFTSLASKPILLNEIVILAI
jgi:predicted permease